MGDVPGAQWELLRLVADLERGDVRGPDPAHLRRPRRRTASGCWASRFSPRTSLADAARASAGGDAGPRRRDRVRHPAAWLHALGREPAAVRAVAADPQHRVSAGRELPQQPGEDRVGVVRIRAGVVDQRRQLDRKPDESRCHRPADRGGGHRDQVGVARNPGRRSGPGGLEPEQHDDHRRDRGGDRTRAGRRAGLGVWPGSAERQIVGGRVT